MHLFCFGLGYCARVIAMRMAAAGHVVSGTATTPRGRDQLLSKGFGGHVFDGRSPGAGIADALQSATHVLLSIPPDADGDPALRQHEAALAQSPNVGWIGYFSTVGVYADTGGGWVDEDSVTAPVSDRGKRRLAAEHQWLDFDRRTGKCTMVFRLPGIYGPGRNALEDIRNGTARRIVKKGQVFNRIHVDDIATTIEAAMRHPRRGGIYNVTDDEPAPPQDVVAYAARLLGAPVPPDIDFDTADLSPMARSFYGECKRASNARIKQDLGVALAYPNYRDGLQQLLATLGQK